MGPVGVGPGWFSRVAGALARWGTPSFLFPLNWLVGTVGAVVAVLGDRLGPWRGS